MPGRRAVPSRGRVWWGFGPAAKENFNFEPLVGSHDISMTQSGEDRRRAAEMTECAGSAPTPLAVLGVSGPDFPLTCECLLPDARGGSFEAISGRRQLSATGGPPRRTEQYAR